MHLILILALPLLALASTSWKSDIQELMAESPNSKVIRQRLLADGQLDSQLTEALNKGGEDEKLALEGVRLLGKSSVSPLLIKKLGALELQSIRGQIYFVTLATLAQSSQKKDILNALKNKADLQSPQVPAPIKITLMSVMTAQQEIPSSNVLLKLLDDPSYELRIAAVDATLSRPEGHPDVIQKALQLSPYTLRLKAVEAVSALPPKLKQSFKDQLLSCSTKDQNETVRKACKEVKF